jgi:O-acetylserine/cysteine efflux transporter
MPRTPALPLSHALLALAAVVVWGSNFVVIKVGLAHLPPLTFAALRFTFAFLPAALVVRRPKAPWRNLALYGLLIGVGQFGLLYIAMQRFISPGLASLVVQMQAFFTVGLAMALTGERVRPYQLAALGLAGAGLAWLIAHASAEVTPLGLTLVLLAALAWAGGNMAAKANGGANMVEYVVWAAPFSALPLYALAIGVEGWPAVSGVIAHADAATWAAVAWQSVGNTLFGYAVWGWLLARHPAATISPLSLLVPVVGMGASAIFLGESLPAWKLTAAALVLGGLALNTFWPALRRGRLAAPAA